MRGRAADARAQPGRRRPDAAAGPLHAVPAHRGARPGDTVPGTAQGAAARPVADALRGAGPGARILSAARDDGRAGTALGDRPVHAGGPAPGGAARLDRPARGPLRGGGRRGGGAGAGRRRAADLPARGPGHRPGVRQQAARPRHRALRPRAYGARRRRGRRGGRRPAGRADGRRAGDPLPGGEPDPAHLGRGVAGAGPAAGGAGGRPRGGALDARPGGVHRPP